MKAKLLINTTLGIATELLYALSIILSAFLTCLAVLSIKKWF
ncbi:MAG: hypothetical protein PHN57_05865 [Candidatus Omnitrophica bacterium]|nr:hypothetical protein [Candidatus Omnitrophota bacterium]